MSFRFTVLTPKGVLLDEDVDSVYFPTTQGPLGVLSGHTPYVAVLSPSGVMKVMSEGKEKYYAVFGGAIEIKPEKTILLSEEVEDGETIDMARAISARDRALDRINGHDPNSDVELAKAALERALTRIDVKSYAEKEKGK
jgi:F-type H+-transporting ATPase subunit epsilon